MARPHDEIMEALETNIQWRLQNKGVKGVRYTASSFPRAWVFQSPVYKKYVRGVFYDHKFYGMTLARNWQAVMEINRAQLWEDKERYLEERKVEGQRPLGLGEVIKQRAQTARMSEQAWLVAFINQFDKMEDAAKALDVSRQALSAQCSKYGITATRQKREYSVKDE